MQRYFIDLSFRGTAYHGWQLQPNAPSVQGEVEKALKILLKDEIKTTGAGRTDTGVHAWKYIAHFDTGHELPANQGDFIYKMNALLPSDISVKSVFPVSANAHARYSAISRTYKYTLSTVKDPFYPDYAWYYPFKPDIRLLNRGAARIPEFDDFKSFAKLHSDVKNHICKVYSAEWIAAGDKIIFTIKANRFLRNMVRAIVGTLLEIGRGKMAVDDLQRIIEGRDRSLAGFSVPAQGLMLFDIEYPDNL